MFISFETFNAVDKELFIRIWLGNSFYTDDANTICPYFLPWQCHAKPIIVNFKGCNTKTEKMQTIVETYYKNIITYIADKVETDLFELSTEYNSEKIRAKMLAAKKLASDLEKFGYDYTLKQLLKAMKQADKVLC